MSFTEADQELWDTDPHEYIRLKFGNRKLYNLLLLRYYMLTFFLACLDVFEDYATPVPAAQTLLHAACKKRKGVLPKAMEVIKQVITSPNADDKQKDGALHMTGTLAEILVKKKAYSDKLEPMIVNYVFPEFNNPHGK